jgi:hypothetical protein
MTLDGELLNWLLDADPALRWQVERDLARAPAHVWQETRAKMAREGFAAQLLKLQDPDGQWAGGAYFPRDFDFDGPEAADDAGQPWTATTWSLNVLRGWGLDASALVGTAEKLAAHCRWEYDDLPYWGGEVDCCINAFTLANGAWLGAQVGGLVDWFAQHHLADGGWNCEWVNGSTRSSFHSTLNVLEGLLSYEMATGRELTALRRPAQEYLLTRHLMTRQATGELVGPWVSDFTYPFRWFYSALRAADYFRAAHLHDATAPDARLSNALDVIRSARQPEGHWLQEGRHPGRTWFDVDVDVGQPSKWLTLFGTRVLAWWDESPRDSRAGT